jgi:streptogramin lyase
VIVGPDGAAWITEGGQNSIARVDSATHAAKLFPLPKERRNANLNTAVFDRQGVLWFTGQNGIYGRFDPKSGTMAVFDAPRGTGPYGIGSAPDGQVFFASLAGRYLGQIDLGTGGVTVLELPVSRSEDRDIRGVSAARPFRQCAAARRPQGRSLGCRIRCRQALRAEGRVADGSPCSPSPTGAPPAAGRTVREIRRKPGTR